MYDNIDIYVLYQRALAAFATLEQANKSILSTPDIDERMSYDPEKIYQIYRDSLLTRFEYTFDIVYSYLEKYLLAEGCAIEVITPKEVFRQGLQIGILAESELQPAIAMVNHRKGTTHLDDESLLEEIVKHMPEYVILLQNILQCTRIE